MRKIEKNPLQISGNKGQININMGSGQLNAIHIENQQEVEKLKDAINQFLPLLHQSPVPNEQKERISGLLNELSAEKEQGQVDQGKVARLNAELGRAEHFFSATSAFNSFISMIMDCLK